MYNAQNQQTYGQSGAAADLPRCSHLNRSVSVRIRPLNNEYSYAYIFIGNRIYIEHEPKRYFKLLGRLNIALDI